LKFIFACGVENGEGDSVLGMWHQRTQGSPILWADPRAVLVIVGDSSKIEERVIAVHVWMMGVGFIVLFMTPCFIAMQMEKEDADD
jgi:hypothetical protein